MHRRSVRTLALMSGLVAGSTLAHAQLTGPSTLQSSYMIPSDPASGVIFKSIASNGNGTLTPNEFYTNLRTSAHDYRLVGIPDGLGLHIRSDDPTGTFRLTCNHELGDSSGIARAHGNRGAFVSEWLVRASDLSVLGGRDLATTIYLWNGTTHAYEVHNTANPMSIGFGRHCSADMAPPSAYKFGELGTDARIHMNGEEIGNEGRAFAYIATGPAEGTAWELPWLGKLSWENSVASPFPQAKTIILSADDSTPGNIYFYVGTKTSTGNDIERAGLTNGVVYAVAIADTSVVSGQHIEDRVNALGNGTLVTSKRFTTINMGDVSGMTGTALQTAGDAAGQMNFLRPEDAAWDPRHPNRAYFVTTDTFGNAANPGHSRLWQIELDDITQPQLGGTITMLFDGADPTSLAGGIVSATGLTDIKMMDNIAVTKFGQITICEDVGNNPRLGRQWLYDIAADRITEVGICDPARFLIGGASFLTQDEETSGVIDAYDTLGPGWFILDMQAHYGIPGELAEGGQIFAMYIPAAARCIADVDDGNGTGTPDGGVTIDDLLYYLAIFEAGLPSADLDDGSGTGQIDGGVTIDDLLFYLSRFETGC